jgi:hypothetical protein
MAPISIEAFWWMAGATLAYDWIERKIQSATFEAILTGNFWLYTAYHAGLGTLAVWVLSGKIEVVWLLGIIASVSAETILSNADIKFGNESLLPIVQQFQRLRAKIDEELTRRQESRLMRLIHKLAEKDALVIEQIWTTYFVVKIGLEKAKARLVDLKQQAGDNDIALKTALAAELATANLDYAKSKLK